MREKVAQVVEAAGGVLYRRRDASAWLDGAVAPPDMPVSCSSDARLDQWEVCVVHRPKYDDWSWPKGKLEPNESHRHAAVREIGEETGIPVALGAWLGEVEYPLHAEGSNAKRGRGALHDRKHVVYWMAHPITEEDRQRRALAFGPVTRADEAEVDEVRWVPLGAAKRLLSHPIDKDILAAFVDRLQEGAGEAQPLLIVRHAKAEARKMWKGVEAARPITPKGAAAAYALNRELACYNPTRLVSSPWRRCQQTIQVLSWQTSREVEYEQSLTEDAFADAPQTMVDYVMKLLRETVDQGEATAVCMHRPVIGGAFARLRELCAVKSLAKQLVSSSPYMPTGSAVALFVVREGDELRIIDVQRIGPLVY